jgi:hypothetical protein
MMMQKYSLVLDSSLFVYDLFIIQSLRIQKIKGMLVGYFMLVARGYLREQ